MGTTSDVPPSAWGRYVVLQLYGLLYFIGAAGLISLRTCGRGIFACSDALTPSTPRPPNVHEAMGQAYKQLSKNQHTAWAHDGTGQCYHLAFLPDRELITDLVTKAILAGRQQLFLLDIGAGKANWARTMATHIDKKISESPILVNIINITGEPYLPAPNEGSYMQRLGLSNGCTTRTRRCVCYNYGAV